MRNGTATWMVLALMLSWPVTALGADGDVTDEAETPISSDVRLRVRANVPVVNAEIMNGEYGINALLGGAVGLDFIDLIVVEGGASWIDYGPAAYDAFARVGALWIPLDTRNDQLGPDPRAGWQFAVPFLAGYRFLHDADETDGGATGSTDIHAVTGSIGWQATYFWSDGWGLELRFLPTLSIPVEERTSGQWGVTLPPMEGGLFAAAETVGNPNDMSWGIDFELTVGVAY